jgi:hypothetical protein
MALDATEQELYDFAMAAMPPWYKARERSKEEVSAMAKQKGAVKKLAAYWLKMCLIGQATGPAAKDSGWDADWLTPIASGILGPDWLELHAEDHGTRRANGEGDVVLCSRLQMTPQTITRTALLSAAKAILLASGISADPDMVEFPRDAAYLGKYTQDSGTGGAFAFSAGVVTFTPTVPFAYPPFFGTTPFVPTAPPASPPAFDLVSGAVKSTKIVLSGCSSSGNNGTFTITGLQVKNDLEGRPTLTAVTFANASGATSIDAGCSWATERIDANGAVMDGRGMCFVNRGCRLARGQSTAGGKKAMGGIIIMLPYGTTESTRLAVREMLRTKKAAGIAEIVERRIGAP